MFEFVCERVIPGCHYKDADEKEEALLKRVADHYRVHHKDHHFDAPLEQSLKETGIQFIRPA